MIDLWTVCWRAPEEKCNDRAMITLYQLKMYANARLTNVAPSDALPRGPSVCWNEPAAGPLGVKVLASRFRSSEIWFEVIIFIKPYKNVISSHVSFWASSKLILTFTKWGGVAYKTTSVHSPHYNFRLRNSTSVHGRQLPSTSASPRYLIHCFQLEWAHNKRWLKF